MYVTAGREVIFIVHSFVEEAPPGKSPWIKENVLSLICSFLLTKYPKSRYAIW